MQVSISRKTKLNALLESKFGGSQTQMALAIGRGHAQVHMWLTGKRNMTLDSANLIEKALKLPPGWFDSEAVEMPLGNISEATKDISSGVELISAALSTMTDEQRETMAGKLASLARAPDSPTLKKSISDSLRSAPLPQSKP